MRSCLVSGHDGTSLGDLLNMTERARPAYSRDHASDVRLVRPGGTRPPADGPATRPDVQASAHQRFNHARSAGMVQTDAEARAEAACVRWMGRLCLGSCMLCEVAGLLTFRRGSRAGHAARILG